MPMWSRPLVAPKDDDGEDEPVSGPLLNGSGIKMPTARCQTDKILLFISFYTPGSELAFQQMLKRPASASV